MKAGKSICFEQSLSFWSNLCIKFVSQPVLVGNKKNCKVLQVKNQNNLVGLHSKEEWFYFIWTI